ncbi:hypothetical protein CTAYLR_008801 [Chrysophaeum taylorii]|uniref:Fe2OG dioxygenase domain-containing protein n=1 Tax=Chrysophaeum taylorii TaxID=2483200 RepID=A0AAD7UK44_9STRA|nr:hypothetical protein CTAYLR_008801 [Chrysophaeum taylorii]
MGRRRVVVALISAVAGALQGRGVPPIQMVFVNPYLEARELYWISPGGEVSLMGSLAGSSGELSMTTYAGHEFGWRVALGANECSAEELEGRVVIDKRATRYVLGEKMETSVDESESFEPFECAFVNRSPRPMMVNETVVPPNGNTTVVVRRGETFDWTDAATGELLYRSVVERRGQTPQTFRVEDHTTLCSDATPPSLGRRRTTYADVTEGRDIDVDVLSEDPWIVLLRNWTSREECDDLERQALRTGLSGAQVFGATSIIADRRALSANLYWNERDDSDVANRLIRRAFDLARHQQGYDVVAGPAQEPLNFIQYAYAEEYRPHCDGVCRRKPYARGGRVATLIHYCKAPTLGGATVFPKLKLKVIPNDDDALLFAYKRPQDGYMDDGFTLHAGCLLKSGTKQIVTMWMREDVHPGEPCSAISTSRYWLRALAYRSRSAYVSDDPCQNQPAASVASVFLGRRVYVVADATSMTSTGAASKKDAAGNLGAAFPHQSLAEKFAEAGAYTEYGEDDVYGVGEGLQRLERDVASHWGCEAGLFCVSGVMAQLVALCAHRETTGRNVVVLHSTSHLLLHERDAVKVLCGFDVRVAGDASRPLSAADVVADYAVLAVIVECPHRELGGAARSLADFKAMREQCESHGVILHVDGARLWEASPYYETSITVFFNSIYVSFYKGLGASAGAMLLGPDDFVARCRPWLRRFGGNLHATAPYALSRARGFRLYKDDFDDRFAKLNDIVQALREARLVGSGKRLSLVPEEPQSAMIHFVVRESRRARL